MVQFMRGWNGINRHLLLPHSFLALDQVDLATLSKTELYRYEVYCSPGELRKAVDDAIAIYNRTPHESLNNVSPDDVYAGRKEVILQKRREKKRFTMERRKQYNLYGRGVNPTDASDQYQRANSF